MTLGWYSVAGGKRTFADTALRAVAFGGDQRSTSSMTPRQVAPKNKQLAFVHSAWRYIAVSMQGGNGEALPLRRHNPHRDIVVSFSSSHLENLSTSESTALCRDFA